MFSGTHRPLAWTVRLCLVSFALLLSGLIAAGEEQYRLSVDQVLVHQGGETATVLLSVLDPAGRPVPGLTRFSVAIDDQLASFESADLVPKTEAGISVLLLIDTSGSMAGEPLAQARMAAMLFVEGLLDQDVAGVLPFASRVPGTVFTKDDAALRGQIEGLRPELNTGTALYDAIVAGLGTARQAPLPRRAVVLLTDGRDSGAVSSHTSDEALRSARDVGIPIFAIGLGADADVDLLTGLAGSSRGAFFSAPEPAAVPAIFDAIGAQLRSQYAFGIALAPAETSTRTLAVAVRVGETVLRAEATFRVPTSPASAEGGGRGAGAAPLLLPGALGVGLVGLAVVGFAVLRRRRRRSLIVGGPGGDISLPRRPLGAQDASRAVSGRLTVMAGPQAGTSVSLTSVPVHIGSDPACELRLQPVDGGVASYHARAWLKNERLMVHHLAVGKATFVEDTSREWAVLEANDTLRIGAHVLVFTLD